MVESGEISLSQRLDLLRSSERETVIVGSSGSVASIKTLLICQRLLAINKNVVLISTQKSIPFLTTEIETGLTPEMYIRTQWEKLDPSQPLAFWFTDFDEWNSWKKRSDPVLHVELRKISTLLLIAPLSANTMAKIANGLCDNLLTCVFRCWDISARSVIVAPAMNTNMYEHPITESQERFLRETLKVKVLATVEKTLMCGDVGKGAMASVDSILEAVSDFFNTKQAQ